MATDNSPKVNPRTIRMLQSENPASVTEAVEEIQESGNVAYLPALLDRLVSATDEGIRKSITGLLGGLKHREVIPVLMSAIQDHRYAGELRTLVSVCWENGLDYSEYLPVFVDLVIEKEFLVAFEAYTVIMNMTGKISNAVHERENRKIKQALQAEDNNKNDLLQDLLDFLPGLEEGIEPGY